MKLMFALLAFGAIALFSGGALLAQVSSCIGADNCADRIKYIPEDESNACTLLKNHAVESLCLCFDTEDICITPGTPSSPCTILAKDPLSISSNDPAVSFASDPAHDYLLMQIASFRQKDAPIHRVIEVSVSSTPVGKCRIEFPPIPNENISTVFHREDGREPVYDSYHCGDCIDLCSAYNEKLKLWVNILKNCTCAEFDEGQKIYYNLTPILSDAYGGSLINYIDYERWPFIDLEDIDEDGDFCFDCVTPYGFHATRPPQTLEVTGFFLKDDLGDMIQDEGHAKLLALMGAYEKVYFDRYKLHLRNDCGCEVSLDFSLRPNRESFNFRPRINYSPACGPSSPGGVIRLNNHETLPEGSFFRWERTWPYPSQLYDLNDPVIDELLPGHYRLLVNYRGCETTEGEFVDLRYREIDFDVSIKHNTCAPANGEIILNRLRGYGNESFTFAWSNSTYDQNAVNLAAGTYSVTVTSARGCTKVMSGIEVEDVDLLSLSLEYKKNVTCHGDGNGSLKIVPSGGVGPYTYVWSDCSPTPCVACTDCESGERAGLLPGDYTVTVTDAKGCSVTDTYTITEPDAIEVELSIDPDGVVTCPCGHIVIINPDKIPSIGFDPVTEDLLWTGVRFTLILDPYDPDGDGNPTWDPPPPSDIRVDPNAPFLGPGGSWGPYEPGEYRVEVVTEDGCVAVSEPLVITGDAEPDYNPNLLLRCTACVDPCEE